MSVSTVTNSAVVVTSEATARFVEAPKPLTLDQAKALFQLIQTFRPDWADWKTVMRKLQELSLTSELEGHEVAAYVIKSAATQPDRSVEDMDFNQMHA